MFKLFDRYVIKEIIPPFLIGLLVFTFVLLMNQILRLSEFFIARGVSLKAVLSLLVFLIPSILALTVPMSVLMAILAGLSRMSSDMEITAFKTMGVSHKRLLMPILAFSLCGWLLTSILSLYLAPRANYKWVQTLSRSILSEAQFSIKPREFNESIPDSVIFIQDITQDRDWKNIFVYMSRTPDEPRIVLAKEGRLNFYLEEKRAILELFNGVQHSYPLSAPEKYRVTSFEHLEEELDVEDFFFPVADKKRVREMDINELIKEARIINTDLEKLSGSEEDLPAFLQKKREYNSHWVEIHKKFSIPFACIAFALLGLPLGASTKKGGRTSGFTISIAIILFYYILITAGEQLAMEGKVSPLLGMWGPNIILVWGGVYVFIKSVKESSPFSVFSRIYEKKKDMPLHMKRKKFVRTRPRISLRFPNILDRYVIRKYLAIFSLVFFGLLSIFVIVTFFERIDNVYAHNKPLSLFFKFIWYNVPEFIHYTLPVSVLVSTLLCLGLLTKFNEITAMKACGISLYRLVLPVLLIAGLVSFMSFYLQENILPYSNKKAKETWNNINDVPPRSYSYIDRRWVMGKERNRIYHYRYYDANSSVFSQLSVLDIDPVSWAFKRRIYSEKGYLRDQNLRLVDSWFRDFEAERPINFEKKAEMNLAVQEENSYFLKDWEVPDQMSYGELNQYIRKIEEKGFETVSFRVDLAYKISFPLASFVIALLGIPFAFSMGKRGALVGIGLSIVIAIVYWGAIGIFKSLGYANYLNAFLAAWAPNLIFGLVGIYLLFTLRT